MDWAAAIERNHAALKRVLALLVAMSGFGGGFSFARREGAAAASQMRVGEGNPSPTISRPLHRAVLRLLRPAEAAVRRLVIVMARDLVVPPARPKPASAAILRRPGVKAGRPQRPRAPSLPLLDPLRMPRRKRPSASGVPRICVPGFTAPFPIVVRRPGEPVSSAGLVRRLEALGRVLDDPARQARRFARWRANVAASTRETAGAGGRSGKILFRRVWPLRPGRPPGWQRRSTHEVHELLTVVHGLAFWVLEPSDTS